MRIGLIVAIEMDAIFAHYREIEELSCPGGFNLYLTHRGGVEIYILHSGMGVCAASAGVQFLVSACKVDMIVNFGVVGGLTPDMKQRKVCVVDRVVHYKYDCSEFLPLAVGQVVDHDSIFLPTTPELVQKALETIPGLTTVTCCSGDKFVDTQQEKLSIHERFQGDVCDMESAGIVLTCEMNEVPCLLMKAVSDGLADGAKGFYEELLDASYLSLSAADSIITAMYGR